MALTRAQLLAGNQGNGVVLSGQPQGVIAGPGISISNTGIISVDSSSVTGLVKLNDPFAYNSYVWPGADGAAGEFLQTDGAGNLDWATPQGIAVVTVKPTPAPAPADIGELWFDCSTGTLNVYQDCVGSPIPNWFNVAQPGFPVDPMKTGAFPAFSGGNGTQATPYLMSVTSTGVGTTVAIVNTVTVNGLAPYQYVPIVDLNAVINGGRFSFTNYYANASGQLIFNTIFSDLPTSGPGQNYIAAIRVGYATAYIQASVTVTAALTLSQGTITGTPTVGTPVAYTPGVAAGGTPGYTYAYQWKANGNNITGATNAAFTPTSAQVGQTLSVVQTVTDSAGSSVSNTTTASAQTATAPFPSLVWAPTPLGGMSTNPGGISGTYSGTGTTITVSGCIESAVYTPPALPSYSTLSKSITSGQTLAIRWTASALCGNANTNTTMNGTVSDGTYTNSYMLQINRVPAAIGDITDTNVALGATVSEGIATSISGLNSVAYVTAGSGSTGLNIGVSLTAGGPFTSIPAAGSTLFPITNGQTLYVQQTVGSAINTAPGYTAVVKVGDADGVLADEFTYFAQTVNTAVFPGVSFSPVGSPNAAPDGLNGLAGGTNVGTLYGFITSNAWPGAVAATLSSPASGANPTMKMRTGTNAYASTGVPVAGGQTLDLAWNEAYLATVADGSPANGSITGTVSGTTYTNTFTMTVRRAAAWSAPLDPGNAATGTQQTTNAITVNDFNVPVTVSFAAPSTGTLMGNVIAVVGGVSTTINPITTTVTLNPGQTFEVLGDTGGTGGNTYGVAITIGTSAAQDWLVTTSSVPNAIQAPVMSPTGSGLNPAANSPAGITLGGGTYTPSSGSPGPHTSSDWQLFGNLGSTTKNPETSGIQVVTQNAAGTWTTQTSGTTANLFGVTSNAGLVVAVGSGGAIFTSTNNAAWTSRPSGTAITLNGVCYGGGQFVAVGGAGAAGPIRTSSDGITWNPQTNPIATGAMEGVCYGNNLFVAVGWSSGPVPRIITSPDAVTWTSRSSGIASGYLSGVVYGNNTYVAVGTGVILTSSNGTTWNSQTGAGTNELQDVAYANGLFVAVGGNSSLADPVLLTSPDGSSWTPRTVGSPGAGRLIGVTYSNGLWVAVGSATGGSGQIYTSSDAITWTSSTSGTVSNITSVTYANGEFVAVGDTGLVLTSSAPAGSTTLTVANTTDLASMQVGDTVVEVGGGANATGVITAITPGTPSITVAPPSANWSTGATAKDTSRTVTVPNQPLISTNTISGTAAVPGTPWTSQTGGGTDNVFAVTYGGGQYVAVGQNNTSTSGIILTSPTGTSWTPQTGGGAALGLSAIAYGNSTYVAAGAGGVIVTSANGTSWTPQTSGTTAPFNEVIYANSQFVAVGNNGVILTSSNGTSWAPQTSGTANQLAGLNYVNSLYFAVGQNGTILTSSNGTSWTPKTSGTTQNLWGIAYGNSIYVAVGFGGTIITSPDGNTWTTRTSGTTQDLYGLSFANGQFVASGVNGTILTSVNGISWTSQTSGTTNTLIRTAFGNSQFIVVGYGGTILTSANPTAGTALTISGADTDGFAVGNLISNGVTGASAASGTITAINATTVTVTPQSANWAGGQNLYRGETIVDVANNANLETYFVAQSLLAPSTTYWSRARYSASSTSTTSPWANWASFSTASSFIPPIGAPLGGGYFAGQIRVPAGTGTIYNLIVAPVGPVTQGANTLYGQRGGSSPTGVQWKNAATGPDGGASQNADYGKTWTDAAAAIGTATYPLFGWCVNDATGPNNGTSTPGSGIGGFNDWYIPAKNELAVLYFFLKPNSTANNTTWGSNPNSVAPYTPNTAYSNTAGAPTFPAPTTATAFVGGTGGQAFSSTTAYWSSTEVSGLTSAAWNQGLDDGFQNSLMGKSFSLYARAIRRVVA